MVLLLKKKTLNYHEDIAGHVVCILLNNMPGKIKLENYAKLISIHCCQIFQVFSRFIRAHNTSETKEYRLRSD